MASIVYLLLAPTIYMGLATLGLLQFSIAFNAISGVTLHLDKTPALDSLAPGRDRHGHARLTATNVTGRKRFASGLRPRWRFGQAC